MNAFEVMLSESQERMLLLVEEADVARVAARVGRWGLQAAVVGRVLAEPVLRVHDGGRLEGELPIALLVDEVPAYELQPEPPPPPAVVEAQPTRPADPVASAPVDALRELLGGPNLCSRAYAFTQYDSTVQGNTVRGPSGAAAAVMRVEGTRLGLAITTDCNPRYTRLDPRRGAAQAVAEAARNLACVGALPLAVTDCLNFGNPERPQVAWQLVEAVEGLADACRALDVPVVSGNVSLYNETAGRAVAPTPAVGMVGLLEQVAQAVPLGFHAGDAVLLLGEPAGGPSAGEYRALLLGDDGGPFPRLDLAAERRLGDLLRHLAGTGLVRAAQDVADGGLAVALAECCFAGETGLRLDPTVLADLARLAGDSVEAALFSEDQGRAVVGCRLSDVAAVLAAAERHGVPARALGAAGGDSLDLGDGRPAALADLRAAWERGFERLLARASAGEGG